MSMRKVLVISYAYPPLAGVGPIPVVKIVKYLEEFGWSPIVLTVKNPDPLLDKIDEDFFEEEDYKHINIVRAYCFSLGLIFGGIERLWRSIRAIMVPDIYVGWVPHAISVARRIIEKEEVDVIFSTNPPVTNILIGALLKRKTNRPFILDYRDIQPFWFPTKFHALIERKIHELALRSADSITVVNLSQKETLLRIYPFLEAERIKILELSLIHI